MLLKRASFYLAIGGITATVMMVARLNGTTPEEPPPIEPPANPFPVSVAASGIIEALRENVAIGVPEPGLVTDVHVKVWDTVQAGAPLITLDDRDLRARLAVNKANALVAEATVRRLQDQLARLKRVNDARAVSAEELRTKEHDVAVAQAQLEASRAQVMQNQVELERMVVLAPRAGTILQVNIRAGEYASVTPKAPALILGDVDELQVRADVDEQNAPRLQPGQSAIAYLKGDTTRPIELQFLRIEPYVVPKVSLTGGSTERVDTRVLQVIYSFKQARENPVYVGQQVDVYVKSDVATVTRRDITTRSYARKGN